MGAELSELLPHLATVADEIAIVRSLHAAGHEIAAVYAQPPRPAGRGQRETPCPVHRAALDLGLPVRTPARLRRDAADGRAGS